MKLFGEFDYRNAKAILGVTAPQELAEIYDILQHTDSTLDLATGSAAQRQLSTQLKGWFVARGWTAEHPAFSVPGMHYDLFKNGIPIEIEIGHERLVFPDFFEFLADYSNEHITAAVMIVTGTPRLFGHTWHCSLRSTQRKIESVKGVYLVPTLVIAVDP
jgi:restriction endonuclease BglII